MLLCELFDRPYTLTWDENWAPYAISAYTDAKTGRLRITFDRSTVSQAVIVEFSISGSFDLTGQGDELAIFATVKQAIAEYLQHYGRPKFFILTSKGEKRSKLYLNLLRRYAGSIGYQETSATVLPDDVQEDLGEMLRGDDLFLLQDTHAELDEGWREKTAAAMAAATLGYGAISQLKQPTPQTPQAQIVQPQKAAPQTQKAVPQASIDDKIEASVPEQHREVVRQARAAGIHGDELAHFISQVKKEVGGTWSLTELPPPDSKNPRAYFMRKYDFKKTLGNTKIGDGWLFRGGGYLHLTGRDNYTRCSKALYGDDRLVANPDIVRTDKDIAIKTAIWYWKNRVATHVSDFSKASVGQVTKRVNKGQKGLKQRQAYYQQLAQR
jgi:putative chitinase